MIALLAISVLAAQAPSPPSTSQPAEAAPAPVAPAPAVTTKPANQEQATSKPAAKERILVLDFKVAGAPAEMGNTVANVVAVELGELNRFDVFTSKDMRALLDREATKQELGCDESGESCLAELAGALGAKLVVYGDVSKLDTRYLVNVNLFDASEAVGLGRANVEIGDADELPAKIGSAVRRLVTGRDGDLNALHYLGIGGLALGGVVATVGTVGAALAFSVETNPEASGAQKQGALDTHLLWSGGAAVGTSP